MLRKVWAIPNRIALDMCEAMQKLVEVLNARNMSPNMLTIFMSDALPML